MHSTDCEDSELDGSIWERAPNMEMYGQIRKWKSVQLGNRCHTIPYGTEMAAAFLLVTIVTVIDYC